MTIVSEVSGPGRMGPGVVGVSAIPGRGLGQGVVGQVIPDAVFITNGTGNIGRAGAGNLNDTARDPYDTQLNVSAIDEPIRVILGRVRVGAAITRPLGYASGVVIPVLWGRGEVDAIESFTMGGAALPAGATVTHYTGTSTQTVDATLVAAFSIIGVTWTHQLRGFAYSVVFLPARDSSGLPIDIADFHAVIRGLKCYDPRDGAQVYATPSTWTYTNNPALLLSRMLTDTTFGLGMTPTSAFWSDVTAVANANDTTLSGGSKKRVLNLCLENQQPAESWVKTLAQYAGCFVVPEGSIYRLIPDGTGSSVATLTEANMVEGSFSWSKRDIRKRPNVVYVRFTEPSASGDWIPSIAPQGVDVPAVPSGEQLRGQVVEMPGVTSYAQANREAIERRNHLYLEDLEMSFTLFDEGLQLQLGDVITVSYGALFTSKLMRIFGIGASEAGRWQISCTEYDPASYSSVVSTSPTYTDTNLSTPLNPPTVGAITLTEEIVTVPTGALPLSKIRGTWTAITTYPFLEGYRVVVTDPAGVVVDTQDVPTNLYVSPPLNVFVTYTVKVYARSQVAISATQSSDTITLLGSGLGALAIVYSLAIPKAGWTHNNTEAYTLWPGDPYMRVRTAAQYEPVETTTYPGANQSTPGKDTQALDGKSGLYPTAGGPCIAISPTFDMTTQRTAVFALTNISRWLDLYFDSSSAEDVGTGSETSTAAQMSIGVYTDPSLLIGANAIAQSIYMTGRYVQFYVFSSIRGVGGGFFDARLWAIEFDQALIESLMPTVTDAVPATSSASAGVVVQLPRKYITITNVQITSESSAQANPSYSNVTVSETVLLDNKLTLHCYDASNARVAVPCSIQITGVAA